MLFQQLLLAGTAAATCLHGLSKFKRAEGEEVEVGNFGYSGLLAPHNWASLAPENEACKTGTNQSPININESISTATEAITMDIPDQDLEFENLGTTIEVIVNGTTSFAGSDFRLRQFHIHTPSEHRISEEFFPLEVHMVHEGVTDANKILVLTVLFEMSNSASPPMLSSLIPYLSAISTPGTKIPLDSGLDFSSVMSHLTSGGSGNSSSGHLLQYTGSLTTPPCSEGVIFLIAQEPMPLAVDDFNAIKKVTKFNSRFIQSDLGEMNMVIIGAKAGTGNESLVPEVLPQEALEEERKNGTAEVETEEEAAEEEIPAVPQKGQTITISEIRGEPTHLIGVVEKRGKKN